MFGFGKKKSQEGTEEQLHETMNFGGFGGLKKRSSPGTTEQATRSGSVDNSLLDEVEKYDEKIFVGGQTILAQFRKDTEAGRTHAPKDFFKSVVNNKNEYEPEVQVISAYLFYHWYEEAIENKCKNLKNLLEVTKKLKAFLEGRENTAVLKDFSGYLMVALAVNMIGFLSKENPAKKEELQKAMLSVAALCEAFLKREDSSTHTEQTVSSSSSTNGKPFENELKQNGLTVEQVIEHRDEEDALAFHKKDPNTFSQVANYFYEILLKFKDNLKQDKKFDLDLDASIPLNMLKASSVFSKDTAASYITSTFDVAAFVLNRMAVKDLDGNKLLPLHKFTTGLSSAIENSCNKVLGIETKQQVSEKKIDEQSKPEDKRDLKQLSEAFQNNPNIPDDLKKGLKDITSFFSGETPLLEMQFNSMIEDFTNDQMKEKYLQLIGGNMLDKAVDSLGLQEYYPEVQETKQELKNADAYLDFYVMGVVACMFSEDKEIALKKFAEKMGDANFNDVAAMLFGIVSGAQVKTKKGETGNHALLFELVKQYLPAKKNQIKSELAEGFKERGIDIPDSALEMFAQASETLGVKRQAELAEEMKEWGNPSNAEQPKQEVKEAPKPGFFDDKPKKTEYKSHPTYDEAARKTVEVFKQVAEELVRNVRKALANGGNVENVFKFYCYEHVIRYHLQSAAFAQFPMMESMLYHCQQINRPELHLVEFVTLAHWKPLLEIAYEELYAPILNEQVKSLEDQNKVVQNFQRIARNVVSGMKDNSEYRNMTDEEIIVDFLEVIPFYQVLFLMSPLSDSREKLSPLITEGTDYLLKQSGKYNKTWVTTSLMFAYENVMDMRKFGKGIGLDQFPNQGPNIALLMLFFFHQINMNVNFNDNGAVSGTEPRYPLEEIPEIEPVKENMMVAMVGSHIFEELVPDLESSKSTEKKVESVEQADEVPAENEGGKFSALFNYLEKNKDDIAFRQSIKSLKEGPVKEKLIEFLEAGALKGAIEGLELEEYFPNPEKTEAELKSDDKYIDFFVIGAVATATENKELALKKFSEKMENASNTEIAAMLMGVSSMATGLVGHGKTSHHTDLFELAQKHLGKTSSKSVEPTEEEKSDIETLIGITKKVPNTKEMYLHAIENNVHEKIIATSSGIEDQFANMDVASYLRTDPKCLEAFYIGFSLCAAANDNKTEEQAIDYFKKHVEKASNIELVATEIGVYLVSQIGDKEGIPTLMKKLVPILMDKYQENGKSESSEPHSSTNEIMGKLATLTNALLESGIGDEEDRAKLRKNLEELKGAGFTPGEIPLSDEESGFSPEKTKEIKSKMLPWFKNSGVEIDDDVLALSIVISKIKEAEKKGYRDPRDAVEHYSRASVFKELYPTEFGQAVFYATFAVANTIHNEDIGADMIDGYINILNWVIQQKERAKLGFYIFIISPVVEMTAEAKNGVEELKDKFNDIMEDFQLKLVAWSKEEHVDPEIMRIQ